MLREENLCEASHVQIDLRKSKPVLEGFSRHDPSGTKENDKGGENENPFPMLNRCNMLRHELPAEAVLMRHSCERTAHIPVCNHGS